MSNSSKKPHSGKKPGAKKKATPAQNILAVLQKNYLIITAVALVALVVILIIAFSGPKATPSTPTATTPLPTPTGPDAAELVAAAPGKLTILCDVKLTLGFDDAGNVIALTGDSDPARTVAAECDIAGMSCVDAMAVILPKLEGERVQMRTYITIRQEQGGVIPSETFMKEVDDAATAATEVPVVVISVSDMDENGYFGVDMAKRCIRAALSDHAEIVSMTDLYEGIYIATIKLGNMTQDYEIAAVEGTVTVYDDTPDEPYDESLNETLEEPNDNPNEALEDEEDKAGETTEEENKEETPAA